MLGSEHILVSLRAAKDGQGWKNAIDHLQRPQSIGRYAPIGPYHLADQGIPYNPIVRFSGRSLRSDGSKGG